MRKSLILVLLVAVLLSLAGAAQAKPGGEGGGGKPGGGAGGGKGDSYPPPTGVIYAGASGAGLHEINPDGSGGTAIACPSGFPDLTQSAIADERWFLFPQPITGETDPRGFTRDELFVFAHSERNSASCAHIQVSDFANTFPYVHPMIPKWSPDGTMVAFVAWSSEEDAPGAVVGTYDVWIADVSTDGGVPNLTNIRDLSASVTTGTIWPLSWSSDSEWITYSRREWPNNLYSVYVVNVSSGAEFNVTPDPEGDIQPAFAPSTDGTTYEIAFMRGEDAVTPTRYLWTGTLTVSGGAPTGSLTGVTQLTTKKSGNISSAGYPAWEPDGNYLVFSGTGSSLSGRYDLYRVRSDGKGKAVSITDFLPDGAGAASIWRSGP